MQYRPPFDDVAVRAEFRQRLNAVPGVDPPAVKLAMRRGFEVALLSAEKAQERLLEAMGWFRAVATGWPLLGRGCAAARGRSAHLARGPVSSNLGSNVLP